MIFVHPVTTQSSQNLLKQDAGHIRDVVQVQSSCQNLNNWLRIKTSIDIVRWLTLQIQSTTL
jgi:hypothetical protein